MPMRTMPSWLQWLLPRPYVAITLPPWGMFARPGREADPQVAAHEAVHWAQATAMGVWRFYATYLWQLMRYGYAQHPMEQEARRVSSEGSRSV